MPASPGAMERKASVTVRRELLRFLAAPEGAVVIARRPGPGGDVLVVRMASSASVPPERRPDRFNGFPVDYEIRPAIKAGWS
jgi:hypothetical protein